MATCAECDGTGECQNDYHPTTLTGTLASMGVQMAGVTCPACGSDNPEARGKCSRCGGTGEVEDDD